MVAAALLLIYWIQLPVLFAETKSRYRLTRKIERIVMGVARARELHPGKIILLSDLSDELFWNGMLDHPFRVIGVSDVYISPDTQTKLISHPELGDPTEFILPATPTLEGLK